MQMSEVRRICVSAERLLSGATVMATKTCWLGGSMAASGAPPLFCIKKPTTNLQMTCFTNESRIALGQVFLSIRPAPEMHADRDRYSKRYWSRLGIMRVVAI